MPPGDALDAVFTVRVRKDERTRFEALAAAAGVSLTRWARRVLNDKAGVSVEKPTPSKPPKSKKP